MNLSVYSMVAYDNKYLAASISSYYNIADEIILAVDIDRISWSKNKFDFDMSKIKKIISEIDTLNKIRIVEGNFHDNDDPIENHTYERNYITSFCKEGNYILAIDSDEIVLNAQDFMQWLVQIKPIQDIDAYVYTVFKNFESRLIITEPFEKEPVGTTLKGEYKKLRITSNARIQSPLKILNYSFGREHEEVIYKLKNWHYSKLYNFDAFMNIWRTVNFKNLGDFTYFHPLKVNSLWKNLRAVELSKLVTDSNIVEKLSSKHSRSSIIVPIKNQFKIVGMCLESIQKYYSKYDVCLVDDGSTEPQCIKMIQDYVKANSTDWKMIRHETSLGHTKASEAGINDTFCENIFLLNSDTILTKNSLKILEGVLNDNEKIAVVGSTTSSASGVQLNQIANVNRFKWNVKDIEKFALEIEKDKGIEDIDLVNGFCFGIKRSVFSRLGGFDKNLNCYGNEKELLIRVRNAGYRTVWVKGSYIHHFGKMSYLNEKSINIGQCQLDGDRYIKRKHGKLS